MRKKSMNAFRLRRQSQENCLKQIINHLLSHAQQRSYPIHADCTESFSIEFAKIELAKERFTGPMKKCWKFDYCETDFSGKLKCFLCNLTRDDKSEVSNPLFVFNMFSQICAQWLKIQDNYSPQKGLKLLFILFLRTSYFNLFRRSCWK